MRRHTCIYKKNWQLRQLPILFVCRDYAEASLLVAVPGYALIVFVRPNDFILRYGLGYQS